MQSRSIISTLAMIIFAIGQVIADSSVIGIEQIIADGSAKKVQERIVAGTIRDILMDSSKTINDSKFTAMVSLDLRNDVRTYRNKPQCKSRVSCASTFKIALSLIGFDVGILSDENNPKWTCKDEYQVPFDTWRGEQTPLTWMKNSVVWYSQELTLMLGMKNFQHYVQLFDYGNKDISGNPQKGEYVARNCTYFGVPGLINSWLSSTLKISPNEQVDFLDKIVENRIMVSRHALEMTKKIVHRGKLANGADLYGKTGTAIYPIDDEHTIFINWFVGWIEKDGQKYIFAANRYLCGLKGQTYFAAKFAEDISLYLSDNYFK